LGSAWQLLKLGGGRVGVAVGPVVWRMIRPFSSIRLLTVKIEVQAIGRV
jgi:hypothetical protein